MLNQKPNTYHGSRAYATQRKSQGFLLKNWSNIKLNILTNEETEARIPSTINFLPTTLIVSRENPHQN